MLWGEGENEGLPREQAMLSLCACMVNDLLTPLEAAEDTTSMVCNPEVNGCRTQTNWSIIAISAHIESTTPS